MKKKYKEFMGGSDGTSIEELIKGNLEDVNQIKKLSIENENNIKDIYEKLEYTLSNIIWNLCSANMELKSMRRSMM